MTKQICQRAGCGKELQPIGYGHHVQLTCLDPAHGVDWQEPKSQTALNMFTGQQEPMQPKPT